MGGSPLFASVALAARIERAECRLLERGAEATHGGDTSVWMRRVGGGLALHARAGSPMNKVAGLGFGELPSEEELAEIERVFDERQTPVQVELSSLANPECAKLFTRRGYSLVGFENILGQGLDVSNASPFVGSEPTIRELASPAAESPDFEAWLDVVLDGFAHPDSEGVASHEEFPREVLAAALSDMARTEGFRLFLACLGEESAGGASMFASDGVLNLCGSATRPALRRRGVQSALLAERLRLGHAAGCDVAVVTTLPGSKSQENVQRQGFLPLYTRAILLREP